MNAKKNNNNNCNNALVKRSIVIRLDTARHLPQVPQAAEAVTAAGSHKVWHGQQAADSSRRLSSARAG